jgi:hypothetical protein
LSAAKANPRIWLATGVALLLVLGLWAGGVFDARRETAVEKTAGGSNEESVSKAAGENSADRDFAQAESNRRTPDPYEDQSTDPAHGDPAGEPEKTVHPAADGLPNTTSNPAAAPVEAGTSSAPGAPLVSTTDSSSPALGPAAEEIAAPSELLKSARKNYAADVKNAERALAAQFDKEINALVKARLKPEDRVHLNESLKAEKAAFEYGKLIPWSRPLRPAVLAYLKDLMAADAAIQKAYDRHMSAAIKAKDDAALEALRTELRTTAPRRLLGTWDCTGVTFNAKWTWNFFSDGTFQRGNIAPSPGDEFRWSLDGSLLHMKAVNTRDPNGNYDNRCTIAVDGGSFTGENNRNQRFAGTIDRSAR